MTQVQSVINNEFFTEKELTGFLKSKDASDFKTHIYTYAKYEGLVTQIIDGEESLEHIPKLKELDQKAIEHIKAILTPFFISKSESQLTLQNPTFEEAITFLGKPSNRKETRSRIMKAKERNQSDDVYNSRAFHSFEKMLLSFDKNEPIKLARNTLDITLHGNDSWVADIVHLYRGASDMTRTVSVTGLVRLLEAAGHPTNIINVYMETCSVTELIGQTVQTQKSIPVSAHLYHRQECLNKAIELGMHTVHPPLKDLDSGPLIELIVDLSYLIELNSVADKPLDRAKAIEKTFRDMTRDSKFTKKQQGELWIPSYRAIQNYLERGVSPKLSPGSRANYLRFISTLIHIINVERHSNQPAPSSDMVEKLTHQFKLEGIPLSATKHEFNAYLTEIDKLSPLKG